MRTPVVCRMAATVLVTAGVLLAGACGKSGPGTPATAEAPSKTQAPPGFVAAFEPGFTTRVANTTYVFRTERIGRIDLPTGRLVACDPFLCDDVPPFTTQYPTGTFPVDLAIARSGDDERVAFARIVFSDAPVARREPALVAGQDAATLPDGAFFGYGVDSGTGAFMDEAAMRAYQSRLARDGEAFTEHLIGELEATYSHTRSWLLLPTEAGTIALFSSGYGDGGYPTWNAYDAAGNLVAAITDFGVVP